MNTMTSCRAVVWVACLGMLFARGPSAAATVETAVANAGPRGLEALDWAWEFGSAIPAEAHRTERSACQYKALRACLDLGQLESTAERLSQIADWRRGALGADLATAYAQREGIGLMMQHWLEQARRVRDTIEGHNAGWQKDRITVTVAVAQAKAGLLAEAEATIAGVEDPVAAQVQTERLGRITEDADFNATMQELETMGLSPLLEVQEATVRSYTRLLENHGQSLAAERVDRIQDGLAAVLPKLPALLQGSLRIEVGRALLAAGQRERGLQALDAARAAAEARGLNPRFDVAHLAGLAEAYHEAAGDGTQAAVLLGKSSELLASGTGLDLGDRVSATIALAAGYAACGQEEPAWGHFRAALAGAGRQANGRPRHIMLTDLCVAIGRAGCALPADVRQALEQEWRRRGVPW